MKVIRIVPIEKNKLKNYGFYEKTDNRFKFTFQSMMPVNRLYLKCWSITCMAFLYATQDLMLKEDEFINYYLIGHKIFEFVKDSSYDETDNSITLVLN